MLDQADKDLIMELATSSAPLDKSPKKNWVENAGGLPPYVRKLARAIAKNGHDLSSAIAIAISRIKVWAAGGGGVDKDTQAKAVKALAQWEKAKASSHVKLSYPEFDDEILMLSSVSSFNTEIVRTAWDSLHNRYEEGKGYVDGPIRSWIRELHTDYIIVEEYGREKPTFYKVAYTVDEDDNVEFGVEHPVHQIWVPDESYVLTFSEQVGLRDVLKNSPREALDRIIALTAKE